MRDIKARTESLLTVLHSEGVLEDMIDTLLSLDKAFDEPSVRNAVEGILEKRTTDMATDEMCEMLKFAMTIGSIVSNTVVSLGSISKVIDVNKQESN